MNRLKTCVITGANSGIGFQTALQIANKGFEIILICKDHVKGEIAKNEIIQQSGNPLVYLYIADLSSQTQIRLLAKKIENSFDKVDVLINNAGCNFYFHTLSEDGVEMNLAVNHLAPFLLSNLLLSKMKLSEDARIINVNSRAHSRGKIYFDDLNLTKQYSITISYNQSKLANMFFTYEFAKRLANTNVKVNAMHPGLVDTPIGSKNTISILSLLWKIICWFGTSPEVAAKTSVFMATSQEIKNVSCCYFADCKQIKSSTFSYNEEASKRLWNISEELVGLNL